MMDLPPVNIESGFFYFIPPHNREEIVVFRDKLEAYKIASFYTPLQSDLPLVVTNYMRSYHDPPSPRARELPPLIRKGTGHFFTMPQLVLKTPLQVGDKKWSQVWTGIMASKDLPDIPPTPVVIKLFQESFFHIRPGIGSFWGKFQYAEWLPGARLAANEAYAYDHMRPLQGRSIPWSYGFCKCLLPNGETTFGHVMELIDGPTGSAETVDELGLDETGIFNLADSLAMAVYDMHECDIAHWDLTGRNVIIQHNPSTQDCNAVLLDFAFCRALAPPSLQKLSLRTDMDGVLVVLQELGIVARARLWAQSRLKMNVPYREVLDELYQKGVLESPEFDERAPLKSPQSP